MTEHSDGIPSVLVVEDDRDLLSVLQRILSGEGFTVRSAQDGEAGLLEALDHSPEIELTQKEYALLEYLMRNMGRTVSRQMISEHVWRQQVDPLTNVVDVYINYLRKKLEEDREHPLIHTVRGSGYVLRDDTAPVARQE
jgi:DNA-binding response OmpR family regulator